MVITGEVLFVLADTRSGSTLVDQLLGAHPRILSLGEVHWLSAYIREDRSLYNPQHPLVCTCGAKVSDCGFWLKVADALGRPLDSLQLRPKYFHGRNGNSNESSTIGGRLAGFARRMIQGNPGVFRTRVVQKVFGSEQLVNDSLALFEAIFQVTGSSYLVDSSKLPFRFRAIYDRDPDCARALILGRDYRAVVHSKMKRGRSLEGSALGWKARMNQIEALTADVPATRKLRIKYEALCANPEHELKRMCSFLGLEFIPAMLQRPADGTHHIGGSPSKFDASRRVISLDTSYETAFSSKELGKLRALVGTAADIWEY